ncbi:hypothetical protein NE237_029620 [Protea cynaroides]|uniref:25S rRNA (uridine-N(3))-methyltransferase BMT5-like domain-containing protein n=1 Tax=Protea cynaroides TaxID=273540 RepID=A0A9Q0JWF3_9MAGN|nr:hypothetical protein NE237_029620 [Protea cynaroides]
MGQALSNLVSILFGRKKKAKNPDEENREPLLSASGDPETRVSEDERVSIIIDSGADQIVEKIKSSLHVSTRDKTRDSEDERVSVIIDSGADQTVEKIKPTLHVSTGDKTKVSEDEGIGVDQIVEKIKPTLHVSTGDKIRDSEDERVSVIIDSGADQIVEKINPTLHVSTGDKTRVSKDERVFIICGSGVDQIEENIKPTLHVSTGDKTRVSEDEWVSIVIDSGADQIVKKIKPTRDKTTVSKGDLGAKAPNRRVLKEERRIKHYYSSHKILLVGEGDFSFSACLAKIFGSADNMVSTSLDPIGFLKKNYSKALSNINDLKSRGCMVLHEVDATTMSDHVFLKCIRFDRIIYNFPYAGWFKQEPRKSQKSRHQKLVTLFFKNAKKMLSEEGEIHISHKSVGFHQEWNIVSLASLSGLNFIKAKKFNLKDYPGYNTKFGFGGDGNFNCNPSQTYMFGL